MRFATRGGLLVTLAIALTSTLVAAPGWAQSRRYPPEPIDRDREAEQRSRLWENAANPNVHSYEQLVNEARRALGSRTSDGLKLAIDKLGAAIALVPDAPSAHELRGSAHMQLQDWKNCALDLEAAMAAGAGDTATDPRHALDLRRSLGICLARAGQLADAERVLAEVAITGTGTGEMLMRLGEVRIAMGKLDEAIAALHAALDARDLPSGPLTHWLLAAAYDRARRPADAANEARRAILRDRNLGALVSQVVPLLGTGETEYLLGLAYSTLEPPVPEKSLVYFRRFLAIAPDSPWRRRAEEHVHELERAKLPEAVSRVNGVAALDLDAAAAIIRRSAPAMRACMARLPASVFEVMITRSGPRSSSRVTPVRGSYRHPYRTPAPPPEGVSVELVLNVDDVPRAETDAAARCIEPIASRIALPPVKEPDRWYKLRFYVISP